MDGPGFGDHLRRWRRARGLGRIDLAAVAEVSAPHISFLGTGRAQPGRERVPTLAQALGVPLRERNPMLTSAGLAAMYPTRVWDDPDLRLALRSVRTVRAAPMLHPALVLGRLYNVGEAHAEVTEALQIEASMRTYGVRPETPGSWRVLWCSRLRLKSMNRIRATTTRAEPLDG